MVFIKWAVYVCLFADLIAIVALWSFLWKGFTTYLMLCRANLLITLRCLSGAGIWLSFSVSNGRREMCV